MSVSLRDILMKLEFLYLHSLYKIIGKMLGYNNLQSVLL